MLKNYKRDNSNKYDNISVTAYRIITILKLLLEKPCNDKEINEKLIEEIGGSRELSKDTICIYLNTLRYLGCEITRPSKRNGYKYILKTHPFKLSLENQEIETLMQIRKYISLKGDWKTAIKIDRLFNGLIDFFAPETKEFFLKEKKTNLKREISSENFFYEIKQLEKYCIQNKTITLLYNSPESGEKNITLKAQKITLENGAFYIWGYNEEKETLMYLRIDRILDIKSVNLDNKDINPKSIMVKYKLRNYCPLSCDINENEAIVHKTDNELYIEAVVTNKFSFFQKILSYGDKCVILYPENIQNEIFSKLEKMRLLYSDID